jgi:hypothetical protein
MAVGTIRLMKPSERRGIGRRLGLSVNAKLVTRPAHERRCATGDDSLGVGSFSWSSERAVQMLRMWASPDGWTSLGAEVGLTGSDV